MRRIAHHALPDGFGDKLLTVAREVAELVRLPHHVAAERGELLAATLERLARFPAR